jgi:hypothetical protein
MIHHQAITRPAIGSVDSLMTIIALTPMKTETQAVIPAAGQIVNTNPRESILLSLDLPFQLGRQRHLFLI